MTYATSKAAYRARLKAMGRREKPKRDHTLWEVWSEEHGRAQRVYFNKRPMLAMAELMLRYQDKQHVWIETS